MKNLMISLMMMVFAMASVAFAEEGQSTAPASDSATPSKVVTKKFKHKKKKGDHKGHKKHGKKKSGEAAAPAAPEAAPAAPAEAAPPSQ